MVSVLMVIVNLNCDPYLVNWGEYLRGVWEHTVSAEMAEHRGETDSDP